MSTILVVEDEVDILMSLNEILQNEGFEVLCAKNGVEGLKLAYDKVPDLILSDIRMPKMDGIEFLKKLQENLVTATIPFIFLTAKVDTHEIREGMVNGADDYLLKPFRVDEILDAINTRLQKKKNYNSIVESFSNTLIKKIPHELRTPLVGILGYSELIEDEIEVLSKDELKQMVGNIKKSGKRLHRRIEKFLAYAELLSLDKKLLLNNDLSNENYQIDPEYLQTKIKKDITNPGRSNDSIIHFVPGELSISAEHFETIVGELVENAAKFSQPGTTIKVLGKLNKQYYTTKVSDHGIGMQNINTEQISPFNQIVKDEIFLEGLGLGLSIVKLIVELNNGYLKVKTRKGKGTVFEFGIPILNKSGEQNGL
jgi:DNA-binding response OmpR family regulator